MTALTPDDLAHIEELARRASMPPWEAMGPTRAEVRGVGHTVARAVSRSDSEFIAAARTAVPALVAGVRSLQAENAALVDARDEVQEKIAYLRRNCVGIPEQELRQKIGAVGSAEWARGYYWNTLVAEHRDKQVAAEVAQRQAEAEARSLQARITELETKLSGRDCALALSAEVVAQLKAKLASSKEAAWDEGFEAGDEEWNGAEGHYSEGNNPYRAGADQ